MAHAAHEGKALECRAPVGRVVRLTALQVNGPVNNGIFYRRLMFGRGGSGGEYLAKIDSQLELNISRQYCCAGSQQQLVSDDVIHDKL